MPVAQLAACFWNHQQKHCHVHQCPPTDTIRPTTCIPSTASQPIRTYVPIRLFSHLYTPCPFHSSLHDYANSARSTKLIMQFSATSLGQNVLPNSLLSNSLNLGASPKKRQPFSLSHTHKTGGTIIELFFTALSGSYPAKDTTPTSHQPRTGACTILNRTVLANICSGYSLREPPTLRVYQINVARKRGASSSQYNDVDTD